MKTGFIDHFSFGLSLLVCALLTGCSTIYVHDPVQDKTRGPLALSWCVTSSSEMNKLNKTLSGEENQKEFTQTITLALNDVEQYLLSEASGGPLVSMTIAPRCLDQNEEDEFDSGLYLHVELTGYGSIKKKWKKILIGTGAIEALVQGVVVGAATSNPWLGFAVGAEEMGSEYLTWNGVDWLLGESFAPVTLEAHLVYQQQVIWQDSDFVTENDDALSDADKKNKTKQLAASLHAAEEKLFSNLNHYLQKEVSKTLIYKVPDESGMDFDS